MSGAPWNPSSLQDWDGIFLDLAFSFIPLDAQRPSSQGRHTRVGLVKQDDLVRKGQHCRPGRGSLWHVLVHSRMRRWSWAGGGGPVGCETG